MLDFNQVTRLLDESGEEFASFRDSSDGEVSAYRRALEVLPRLQPDAGSSIQGRAGARLLEPVEGSFFVPFREPWKDRDGCMEWMDGVLGGQVVAAVDGGQVYPERASGVPVALLQAGVAINEKGTGLRREGTVDIIGPGEFVESIYRDMPVNSYVDARRFAMECDAAARLAEEHEDITVLMDYPLLVPHLLGYQDRLRYTYLHAVKRMLRSCEERRNPAVGFVDRSVARDLTAFLYALSESGVLPGEPLPSPKWTYDGLLLRRGAKWGTRTRALLLDRDDSRGQGGGSSLDLYEEQGDRLAFFYICTDGVAFSRVEVPRFVVEEGRLGEVVDVILAQTVLRGNYPDIIHQAHRAASITRGEARLFSDMFDRFCRERGLEPDRSWKQVHKGGPGVKRIP